MKNEKLRSVRGSTDYGGKEAIIRNYISKTLQDTIEKYGYEPLETSILCYYDLLTLKYDKDNDIIKEIYRVSDQGNRELALRYDLTVPFAKYIATNQNIKLPYKRFEIGKVFRDGPIKKGRTREFIQCDVDCVGIEGQMIEAELISLYVECFKKLGINIIIKYNNRKLMNGLIEICDISKDKINQVITLIDKIEKLSREELMKEFYNMELQENQVKKLFEYFIMDLDSLNKIFNETDNENLKQGLDELNELNKFINGLELSDYVQFVPSLARGQEYYTGTIFEVYDADGILNSSIGGGGRYDNIIGDFIGDDKKYPAVGISFGLEAIYEILKEKQNNYSNIQVYIIPMNNRILGLKIANEIRKKNINTEVEMNDLKLKKVLSYADGRNIPIVVIIGENEIKDNKVLIKDMKNNFQICEDIEKCVDIITELLNISKIEYKLFNPGGNKTALVNECNYTDIQKKLINKMIMEKYQFIEQVGFLSTKENKLEMAGGEFCLNATRCAVYEYFNKINVKKEISVSGTNNKIMGKVLNEKEVEIELDINKKIEDLIEINNNITYVRIDGILIAIFDEEESKKYIKELKENEIEAKKKIKQFIINNIKTDEKAIGVMFIERENKKIKINPVVWVKDIETLFYETACGSGSLGVAVYNYYNNKEEKVEIIQPSGYSMTISLNIKNQDIEKVSIIGVVEEINLKE